MSGKNWPLLLAASLLVLSASSVLAEFRRFEARIDEATWKQSGNRLSCSLSQDIPGFGRARFVSYHGKQPDLRFEVNSRFRQPHAGGEVVVQSFAPPWMPQAQTSQLGKASIGSGRQFVTLKQASAWRVWSELEMGYMPSFSTEGFAHGQDSVLISVSAIKFKAAAEKFRACLAGLLPYTFGDIAQSTVYFEFDSVNFTPATKARLTEIREYLSADKSIDLMVIEAHTDNKGGRYFNQQMAQKRGEAVRDFLLASGIDGSRVQIVAYGERKPVAENKTEKGRAKNRRVVIRIEK